MTVDRVRHVLDAIRAADWWAYKIPPLLLTAYAGLAVLELPAGAWRAVAGVLLSILLIAVYGYVQNDICDIEADRRAGRPNRMTGTGAFGRVCYPAVPAAAALAIVGTIGDGVLLGLTVANLLVPMLYSVRPMRLKQRGVWGALADAAGVHALPMASVARAVTLQAGPGWMPALFIGSAVAWAALAGLRGIIVHQVVDTNDDLAAGVRTFGSRLGVRAARPLVMRRLLPIEILALVTFVVLTIPRAPLVLLAVACWGYAEIVKVRRGWTMPLFDPVGRTKEAYVPLVNNEIYEMWLPMVYVVQLALQTPALWALVAAHTYLFFPNMRVRFTVDLRVLEPSP